MSRIFYFEIHQAPSELLMPSAKKICPERLNWPARLAGSLKGLTGFQNKKIQTTFHHLFKSKMLISRLEILVHL